MPFGFVFESLREMVEHFGPKPGKILKIIPNRKDQPLYPLNPREFTMLNSCRFLYVQRSHIITSGTHVG